MGSLTVWDVFHNDTFNVAPKVEKGDQIIDETLDLRWGWEIVSISFSMSLAGTPLL